MPLALWMFSSSSGEVMTNQFAICPLYVDANTS